MPAGRLHQVLAFGAVSISSGAIALCLEKGIPVMLLSGRGRHFGVVDPLRLPDVGLMRAQLSAVDDQQTRLRVARSLVDSKLANSLLMVRRWSRRHERPKLREAEVRLSEARLRAQGAGTVESLRGIEGAGAAAYFGAVAELLPEQWRFPGRRRQPPTDPVNSMLSYAYTLLYYNTLTLVLARGLQPHLGLYHVPRAGHHSLVSDLMEPFRAIVVDALVLDLALNGGVRPDQFAWPEQAGDGCLMSPDSRNRLIHGFESKMNTRVEARGLDLHLDLRRHVDMQVLALADHLVGRTGAFQAHTAR